MGKILQKRPKRYTDMGKQNKTPYKASNAEYSHLKQAIATKTQYKNKAKAILNPGKELRIV